MRRPICWPPDSVCLAGGCIHCVDNPTKNGTQIWEFINSIKDEEKRKEYRDSFRLGIYNDFFGKFKKQ